nr:hypothetical protein [Tanacetum cinerariifolium]
PPPSGPSGASGSPGASGSSQVPPPLPSPPSTNQEGFEYKHDYTVIESLRAVTFQDRYRVQMIMRFNEIHKFSDGTLHQIDKALDYRVKEFKRWRLQTSEAHRMITSSRQYRADLNEHIIAKRDFKYLYPSDFEDLYPLNLQEDFQLGIESYQTHLNLTKPRWDATGFEYKHDYTVIDSLRVVIFRDRYGVQMIMRFNDIHKFSDGTLHQIDEALDYWVEEFKVNRMNSGLNTRFWTRKDVDRSKEFMFTIQKQLKTRRIFRNLESFVGGRVRDGDY